MALRHSLAILIQENFAFWYTSNEDDLTSYEANALGCYNLIRSGKYVYNAEERFGSLAGAIISETIQSGHTTVGELVLALIDSKHHARNVNQAEQPSGAKQVICNGSTSYGYHDEAAHASSGLIHQTISILVSSGLLSITNEFYFYTDADRRIEAEARAGERSKIDKMSKESAEIYEQTIAAQLAAWRYGSKEEQVETAGLNINGKRPLESGLSERRNKQTKLDDNDHHISNNGYLNEDVILRVNHEKFVVLERSNRLAEFARSSIGPVSSRIYKGVLETIDKDIRHCKEETKLPQSIVDVIDLDDEPEPRSLPWLRTQELEAKFTDTPEMTEAIAPVDRSKVDMTKYDHPKKKRRKSLLALNGDVDMADAVHQISSDESEIADDDEENISGIESDFDDPDECDEETALDPKDPTSRKRKRAHYASTPKDLRSALRQHLFLLASQPCKLLYHLPELRSTPESWSVDFHGITKHLLTTSIFQTVTARFGPLAARLLRILHQKGKLDEKNIQSLSLLSQKPMRALLTSMNCAGFLELQEIPKGNDRQPQKTIFLWYFDQERCKQNMLEDTYKAMTRLLQRIAVEREKFKYTVEKSERMDVQGNEDKMLSEGEKKALHEWRTKEERLLGEMGKLDDMVAVLRDF